MTKLLLDEKPLMVMPSLAVKIGLNESIFIQQLHYWLDKSTNVKEGHRWVYNTAKEWQKQFPFWSVNTIRRIVKNLEDKGLVVIDNFNSLPIDKTSWYRINYAKIAELEGGITDSEKMNSTTQSEHSEYPKRAHEAPNLGRPLPEITTESTSEITNNNDNMHAQKDIAENPYSFYEKNGFGILTPHVGEKIGSWIDDMNKELVIHAMKISVENSVPRWSYAETILRDWHSKKITSVAQVIAFEEQRKQQVESAKKQRRFGAPAKEERVPDWFKKDKQVKESSSEEFDIAEERRKLQGELGTPIEQESIEEKRERLVEKLEKMKSYQYQEDGK